MNSKKKKKYSHLGVIIQVLYSNTFLYWCYINTHTNARSSKKFLKVLITYFRNNINISLYCTRSKEKCVQEFLFFCMVGMDCILISFIFSRRKKEKILLILLNYKNIFKHKWRFSSEIFGIYFTFNNKTIVMLFEHKRMFSF